jgi:organic radical activating enzyme
MGISKKPPKPFPIKKGLPCQLKWTHSTVYLTDGKSASCHRVMGDPLEIRDGELNFHNLPAKLEARRKMLRGEWPGRGCEHCKHIEEAGGTSDRMIHLDLEGTTAPPELDKDLEAVDVTPRQLEVYWGNTCNQKCLYCGAHYSSKIQQEEERFGNFNVGGVKIGTDWRKNPKIEEHTELLFKWFDKHLNKLHKIFVMGGEPFLQKETFRFIEFLEKGEYPDLTLVFFSNHNIEHERFKGWVDRLDKLQKSGRLDKIQIFFSCDAFGPEGEYVRTGLDLQLAMKNFNHILYNTNIEQAINSALTVTAVPGMPEMVRHINKWSKEIKPIYWSMMKANQYGIGPRPYMYPGIFGSKINEWGLREAVESFDTKTNGYDDSVKVNYKNYMVGIIKEFELRSPDFKRQKQFKIYLNELDRRRGTDYSKIYPQIHRLIEHL